MERQVTTSEIIDAAIDSLRAALYHSVPGAIIKYDPGTQRADVQPLLNDVRTDPESGIRVSEPWPTAYAVPIAWPRFGGFMFAGPLNAGDRVDLVAWDLDPTVLFGKPKGTQTFDPLDTARHAGHYWRALPRDAWSSLIDGAASGNALVLGVDGGQAQIRINAGAIQLGATGSDFVALASKVLTELNKVLAALSSASVVVPAGGAGGTFPVAYTSPYSPASVASPLIKGQ